MNLLLGQTLLGPPLHVVPRPWVRTHPDQGDPPQRVVGDPVPTSVQPMPVGLARGGRKRRHPAQPCEGTLTRQALGVVPSRDEERSGDIGPHPRKRQQPRGGLPHDLRQGPVELGDLRAEGGVPRARCRRASFVAAAGSRSGPGRNRAATLTRRGKDMPRSDARSSSGEVSTNRASAARGDQAAQDPRWDDPRVPCPRGMNEGGIDLRR
jgi:hypothetical protein